MKKALTVIKCPNDHFCEVKIIKEEGLRYYICPVCNMVVGLRNSFSFTGYNSKQIIELFIKKRKMKKEDWYS